MASSKPRRGSWTRGCLACREGQRSFHHAGADTDRFGEVVRGPEVVDVEDDGGYRLKATARCSRCGARWRALYSYPGKPPLVIDAVVVDDDGPAA